MQAHPHYNASQTLRTAGDRGDPQERLSAALQARVAELEQESAHKDATIAKQGRAITELQRRASDRPAEPERGSAEDIIRELAASLVYVCGRYAALERDNAQVCALQRAIRDLVFSVSTIRVTTKHGEVKERPILSHADKLGGIGVYFATLCAPGMDRDGQPTWTRAVRETIARKIGVDKDKLGDTIEALSRHGYLRKRLTGRGTEECTMYLAPGRVIPHDQRLAPIVLGHRKTELDALWAEARAQLLGEKERDQR